MPPNSEIRSIRIGSAVLITEGETILLGKRNKEPNLGRWVLPGGKIEFGETHEEAARREAKEELGLDIETCGLAGKGIYHLLDDQHHRIIVYSLARKVGGKLIPSSDISAANFFRRDELQALDITPIVQTVLRDAGWI